MSPKTSTSRATSIIHGIALLVAEELQHKHGYAVHVERVRDLEEQYRLCLESRDAGHEMYFYIPSGYDNLDISALSICKRGNREWNISLSDPRIVERLANAVIICRKCCSSIDYICSGCEEARSLW